MKNFLTNAIRNSPKSVVFTKRKETFLKYNSIRVERNKLTFFFNGKEVYWTDIDNFNIDRDTLIIHGLEGSVKLNEKISN